MKLKLAKKTILRGFKAMNQDEKMNALYVEVIKIKRRIKYLNEFQNMRIQEFVSKQTNDTIKGIQSKMAGMKNNMTKLMLKHTKIKESLTWQSRANGILKEQLYKLGVDKDELDKEMRELHNKFKGE